MSMTAWRGSQMSAERPSDVRPEQLIAAFIEAADWVGDDLGSSMRARLRSFAADLPPGTTAADVARAVRLFPAVCAGLTLSPGNVHEHWAELDAWGKVLLAWAGRLHLEPDAP
jgi:hypothetical protein